MAYRKPRALPTLTEVHQWFDVDLDKGLLVWKKRESNKFRLAGKVAGTRVTGGYTRVWTSKGTFAVHHIIWFVATGTWIPDNLEIDHKDRDPSNNAFSNLRLATKRQNGANSRVRTANKTGYKGVYKRITTSGRVRYDVAIRTDGGKKILGNFDSVIAAALAWDAEAKIVFGEYAVLNFPEKCNARI